MSEARQFCTFALDDMFFGVDVVEVQEVIRYQEMTAVPLSSPNISGLINLRGQVVTAVDLRRRLDMPQRATDQLPMNVVVHTDDSAVSLLVDEIEDVREVSSDTFEPLPETLTGVARELVSGVHKLEDRLLLILDTKKAISLNDVSNN